MKERHLLYAIHMLIALSFSASALITKCPDDCTCASDVLRRKTVMCDVGLIGRSIPVHKMEHDMKVLIISSADEQPGELTVGPIFKSFTRLEEVHITRANLPTIGENSFWGLKHLKLLNLTENNITLVASSHLSGIESLQRLHLDSNKISTIPSGAFVSLENLEILTLSQNRLQGLTPKMFYCLDNLKTLDLSNNAIMDLNPEIMKDLLSLRELRCAKCQLGRIRSFLYEVLPQLEILDLRGNYIEYLAPDEYAVLRVLKVLYLDGNWIADIGDYTFRNLGLQHLGLSRNRIERISRFGFSDSSVMSVNLASNRLSFSSLRHLNLIIGHLHKLDLSNNKVGVDRIRELLKRAPRLKRLSLSNMHINHLPQDMFQSQGKLQWLNLSNNHLQFLPVDILHSLPNLQDLDLRYNDIKGLPQIILRRLDRIKRIHLEDNPWSCDQCHIPHLKIWLNKSKDFREACKPDIDAPNCLKCEMPIEMYDKPIIEVDGLELQPCPEGTFDLAAASAGASEFSLLLAIVTAIVVLLLLMVILIIGIIMYNRHSAFYYTHEDDSRRHFYDNPAAHSNHTDITVDEELENGLEEEPQDNLNFGQTDSQPSSSQNYSQSHGDFSRNKNGHVDSEVESMSNVAGNSNRVGVSMKNHKS